MLESKMNMCFILNKYLFNYCIKTELIITKMFARVKYAVFKTLFSRRSN